MLIDWYTVLAQILNFIILVVLLKYLLYDRVIRVMDARQEELATRFREADSARAEADEQAEEYRRRRRELEDRRAEFIDRAEQDAERRRQELTETAREDVQDKREAWRLSLEREQERFSHDVARRAGEQALAVARKTLADLADAELETRLVETFLTRLERLSDEDRERLTNRLRADDGLLVQTSHSLPDDLRSRIADAVQEAFGVDDLSWEKSGELIAGIRLVGQGRLLGWSIDDYLDQLASRIREQVSRGDSTSRRGESTDGNDDE